MALENLFNSLKHPRISHTNGKESMNQMSSTSAEMFLFSLIKTLNSNRVEFRCGFVDPSVLFALSKPL